MTTAPTPMPVPPWMSMIQAHADQAEARLDRGRRAFDETPRSVSRDIVNSVVEDHLGRRPAAHRARLEHTA